MAREDFVSGSAEGRRDPGLADLRRRIAEIEGHPVTIDTARLPEAEASAVPARYLLSPRRGGSLLPFGIPDLDRHLSGGVRRPALHEIRGPTTRDGAAATGFAAALLARLARLDDRPLLWVMEEQAVREGGFPYGPGLDRFGLESKRLIVVSVRRPGEALWVFEEGLSCAGLAGVLAELRGHPRELDLTASRRLALRARDSGVLGLLLRQAGAAEPGATSTRWLVEPLPAGDLDGNAPGIGRPAWRLTLERNRHGATGCFDLEWDHDRRAFAAARSALSVACTPLSVDRPHPPYAAGTVVALRHAS